MKTVSRVLFPTLASFGPLFMVIGVQTGSTSYLRILALVGALMTSLALIILFREVLSHGRADAGTTRP